MRTSTCAMAIEFVPLYEAKMFHQFDHRFGTYLGQTESQARQGKLPELTDEDHSSPTRLGQPKYWVPATLVADHLAPFAWDAEWLLSWRKIARNTDERTLIVLHASTLWGR